MSFFGDIVNGAVDFAGEVANQTKNIASETVTAIGDFPNTVKNLPDTINNTSQSIVNTVTQAQGQGQTATLGAVASVDWAGTMRTLEGKRLRDNTGAIWLVLDGQLRHIENMPIYQGLFGGNMDLQNIDRAEIEKMPKGPSISANPPLISPSSGGAFLIDNGQKRHIADPPTMAFYNFDWGRIVNNHNNSYPDGPQLKH